MKKKIADTIIINANELVTAASNKPKRRNALEDLGIIEGGALAVKDGRIVSVGTTDEILESYLPNNVVDAEGKVVMPGFVDSHTHLIFAGSRDQEYLEKITGKSDYVYEHKRGGGILYTVGMTRNASEGDLISKGMEDLKIMLKHGTTTVEIKTGYGLDVDNELKMLRVIKKLKELQPVDITATYLGAHTFPNEYNKNIKEERGAYVNLVKGLIPEIAKENLAEFCDVWCDPLGFDLEETRDILTAAKEHGLKLKIHVEQTGYIGGAVLASELGAVSADHLDYLTDDAIKKLADSNTIGVLLPGVTYHLMEMVNNPAKSEQKLKDFLPYTVRKMIDSGVAIALATDYNPGSCRTQSMQAIMECAARLYRMSYAEIINASTINAAHAIGRADVVGSLEPGKKADVVVYRCRNHGELIDNFGINHAELVIKNGRQCSFHG